MLPVSEALGSSPNMVSDLRVDLAVSPCKHQENMSIKCIPP